MEGDRPTLQMTSRPFWSINETARCVGSSPTGIGHLAKSLINVAKTYCGVPLSSNLSAASYSAPAFRSGNFPAISKQHGKGTVLLCRQFLSCHSDLIQWQDRRLIIIKHDPLS